MWNINNCSVEQPIYKWYTQMIRYTPSLPRTWKTKTNNCISDIIFTQIFVYYLYNDYEVSNISTHIRCQIMKLFFIASTALRTLLRTVFCFSVPFHTLLCHFICFLVPRYYKFCNVYMSHKIRLLNADLVGQIGSKPKKDAHIGWCLNKIEILFYHRSIKLILLAYYSDISNLLNMRTIIGFNVP